MEEFFSFMIAVILTLFITFMCINSCNSMVLRTEEVKLQKQTCMKIRDFNGSKFILCPGECVLDGVLELCYKVPAEKENQGAK